MRWAKPACLWAAACLLALDRLGRSAALGRLADEAALGFALELRHPVKVRTLKPAARLPCLQVSGTSPPAPLRSFAELETMPGCSKRLLRWATCQADQEGPLHAVPRIQRPVLRPNWCREQAAIMRRVVPAVPPLACLVLPAHLTFSPHITHVIQRRAAIWRAVDSPTRPPSSGRQRLPCWAGVSCWPSRPPAPARRSPSCCRWSCVCGS